MQHMSARNTWNHTLATFAAPNHHRPARTVLGKSYVMLIPTFPFHSRLRTIHVAGMQEWNAAHAGPHQSQVTTSRDVADWLTADALVMTQQSDREVWQLVLGITSLTSLQ
jgi:hypothetical protein